MPTWEDSAAGPGPTRTFLTESGSWSETVHHAGSPTGLSGGMASRTYGATPYLLGRCRTALLSRGVIATRRTSCSTANAGCLQ